MVGRFDAEYFQPKYDELFEIITNYKNGFTKLSNFILKYTTGFPFDSDRFSNEGFPLIRISNIKKGHLDISDVAFILFKDIELSKKDLVNENDLLISMSGTIGNCCKISKNTNAIINQRILKFSVKNFDSDVLCLLINSIVCELQLNRIGTGGVQTNISGTDIFNLLIPNIDNIIQTTISQKIKESYSLKNQAEILLQQAIKMVEKEIENT